jgi:mono/diheme cytochrome c family protein
MRGAIAKGLAVLSTMAVLPVLALAQGNAEKGNALFAKYCAACHGPSGKGDGAAAAALNPKPKDLTDKAYVAGLKDDYLFTLIQKGGAAVGKSPLVPAFGAQLKEGDIKDVIAFVRNLAK